ncbi:MAG: hypothetical protein K2P70_01450 [Hyphomonadaceae bacterium]|nr:hypothetical protein [Hyphomonadaceae bacterium]
MTPRLTAFCTELTGITQTQVDAAPWFPKRALSTALGSLRHVASRPGRAGGTTTRASSSATAAYRLRRPS